MRILILLVALTACAPVAPIAPVETATPDAGCSAAGAESLVGKIYSADSVARARIASGSKNVRVIRPGMAVTMDYRVDRLNIDLDDKNMVTRVHCG